MEDGDAAIVSADIDFHIGEGLLYNWYLIPYYHKGNKYVSYYW